MSDKALKNIYLKEFHREKGAKFVTFAGYEMPINYKKGIPVSINTILISTQHTAEIGGITEEDKIREKIKEDLWKNVVLPATEDLTIKPNPEETRFLVNPTGKFIVGGPQGDAGLTGRKIIVDTYVDMPDMEVGHFLAKIQLKLTDQQHMLLVMWLKVLLKQN